MHLFVNLHHSYTYNYFISMSPLILPYPWIAP